MVVCLQGGEFSLKTGKIYRKLYNDIYCEVFSPEQVIHSQTLTWHFRSQYGTKMPSFFFLPVTTIS